LTGQHDPKDELLTASEVAARLKCRPDTVIRELRLAPPPPGRRRIG
jgi:hypothetical protein